MAYLKIRNLSKTFGDVRAVNNANIEVEKGTFFTLLGPSGCGKTTLLRMVIGFEKPTHGKIIMEQRDITDVFPESRKIGMMFQNYALFPHMTVFENVSYGLKIKKLKKVKIKELVHHYLELVGLRGYDSRKIIELSGGEQQRVALARSLAVEPKILLLDEPLSNLDAKMRDEMRFELKRLQNELKITMLYVTHDQNEALMMSDKIAVFCKGVIQQIGTPDEIYNHPINSFVASFVGQSNILEINKSTNDSLLLNNDIKLFVSDSPNQSKRVSIRNESIRFIESDEESKNIFSAKIIGKQFNGMVIYYTILINQTEFNVTVLNDGFVNDYSLNDIVKVRISPDRILLLGD
ncbi:MAG: ABC transporter ATP-binding protein [Promethearchaeota archaeon]